MSATVNRLQKRTILIGLYFTHNENLQPAVKGKRFFVCGVFAFEIDTHTHSRIRSEKIYDFSLNWKPDRIGIFGFYVKIM